jgi:hypothetical protein
MKQVKRWFLSPEIVGANSRTIPVVAMLITRSGCCGSSHSELSIRERPLYFAAETDLAQRERRCRPAHELHGILAEGVECCQTRLIYSSPNKFVPSPPFNPRESLESV